MFLALRGISRGSRRAGGIPGLKAIVVVWLAIGGALPGGAQVDVEVRDGKIVDLGAAVAATGAPEVDVQGRTLAPAFIDSHVHLT